MCPNHESTLPNLAPTVLQDSPAHLLVCTIPLHITPDLTMLSAHPACDPPDTQSALVSPYSPTLATFHDCTNSGSHLKGPSPHVPLSKQYPCMSPTQQIFTPMRFSCAAGDFFSPSEMHPQNTADFLCNV
ncbi:hypothetical protein B0H19DRAFT_1264513 [Mycena capillaripes]|nr:hypothetical protein B0H19DRAFT_1264513 [Mycena capillaripes]